MAVREQQLAERIPVALERPAVTTPRGTGRRVERAALGVILIGLTALFMFPFAWLISASLKDRAHVFDGSWIPDPIQWQNYVRIFEVAPVLEWTWNSLATTVLAATTVTLSSAFVAFGFAYFRFPGRTALFALVLGTMMLPGAVTMVPTFLIWDAIGKVAPALGVNTLTPLWAGNLFGSAFYIFLLRQFFLSLPRELFEAAKVDGASVLRIWRSIALPLVRPALIVVFIFEVKAAWTEFLKPLIYLRDIGQFTLPRGLKALLDTFSLHGGEGDIQLLMAAAVLATVPMIVVFFLGQRYFVEGIQTTGSKG